ncbi:MAG: DUF4149 domain-containing protein [Acidobacteriota bacterium]
MRIVSVVHDLCLALLIGGIASILMVAFILFRQAPNHEIAGHIGNVLFGIVGHGVFVLALLVLVASLLLRRREASRRVQSITVSLAGVCALVAGVLALWITPRMNTIWLTTRHALDGSGLMGDDRARFMALHGMANSAYLAIWLACITLLVLRSSTVRS